MSHAERTDASLVSAAEIGVSDELSSVIQMTRELFGESPRVSSHSDPENADQYLALHISLRGGVDAVLACESEWHDRMEALLGARAAAFHLTIALE